MIAFHMPELGRIVVVGAGAMGCLYAAFLRRAGREVALLEKSPEVVARIRGEGVTVRNGGDALSLRVPASHDPGELAPPDAVLFCVKCYQTEQAAELVAPLVGERTAVVSLQNGWGNGELLARRFGAERLVVGVTYASSTLLGPGEVAARLAGGTFVGPYAAPGASAAAAVASALAAAGFEVEQPDSIRTEIWKKLVLNAATLPTSALTRLPAAGLLASVPMDALVEKVAREAVAVAQASGYAIDPAERVREIRRVLAAAGEGRSSMLQDVERGARTEVDVLTGAVVRAAEERGVEVPANRILLALVRGYEDGLQSSAAR
jgi:2-dehydropantoate 2-reductase